MSRPSDARDRQGTASRPPLLDLVAAYHAGRTDFPISTLPQPRLAWALECGLAPLLVRCCADDPDAASHPLWPRIVGTDLAARVVAEDQTQAAIEILEACRARVGPVTLLKGIWLSHAVHPEPHLRPMRDLDVMLPDRATARDAARVLVELGYRPTGPEHEYTHANHLAPHRHPRTGVLVDVHHTLVAAEGPVRPDPFGPVVRDHLRPATFRGIPVLRLSDALQIAYLAAHWAVSQDAVDGSGSLVIMLDLPLLARDVDWNEVLGLLTSPAAAGPTLLILAYLHRRGLLPLEPWVLPALWSRQRVFGRANLALLERVTDRWLVDGRPFGRVLATERNLSVVWMGLLNPRSALVNALSLPWALLPRPWRAAASPLARPFARALGVDLRRLDEDSV